MPLAAWPAICDLYELSPVLGDRRRLSGVRDGAKLLKAGPSSVGPGRRATRGVTTPSPAQATWPVTRREPHPQRSHLATGSRDGRRVPATPPDEV